MILTQKEKIEIGRTQLFDFEYPLFDPLYKQQFETHLIRRFYMREIGFETMGLFKFHLETWLIINMPYYNQLFESELLKYDPLTNSRMETTYTKTSDTLENNLYGGTQKDDSTGKRDTSGTNSGKSDGTSKNTSNETVNTTGSNTENGTRVDDGFSRKLTSDNPDSRLQISSNDGTGVIEYASKIEEDKNKDNETTSKTGSTTGDKSGNKVDDLTTSQTASGINNQTDLQSGTLQSKMDSTSKTDKNNVEDYIQHRIGKIGIQSFGKLVADYRNSFLRIENQIYSELNELFMLVY